MEANAVSTYFFFDKEFETFDNEVNFAQMAHLFNGLGEEWAHEFREEFDSKFKTAEEALKGVGELSSNYLLKGIRYCVEYLTGKSLYTYDESAFYERAMEFPILDEWSENFQTLVAEYKSIEIDADTQKAYREMRKNARARMIGGGFGFGGFVKGAITATIFNCATGILHSGINTIGNSVTDAEAKSKKGQLFETLGNKFETEMSVALSNLGYVLMIILHEEDVMTFRYPNEEQLNKFHALFTNMQNGRIPAKDVSNTFIKLLELNPYDKELYKWYLEKHGDSEDLCRLADELCINLNEIKDLILSDAIGKYFDDIVNKHTHELDLQPIVDELDEVLSLTKKERKRLGYKEKCDAEEAIRDVKKQVKKEIKDSENAYLKRLEEGTIVENPIEIDKDKILNFLNNAKNNKGKITDIVFEQTDKDFVETVYFMSQRMGTDFRGEEIILCFYGKDSLDLFNFIMLITNQNTYVYGELEKLTTFMLKTSVIKGLEYYFETGFFFNTSIVTIKTFNGDIVVKNCKLGDEKTKQTIALLNEIIPLVNPASELEQITVNYENADIVGCKDILKKLEKSSCEEILKCRYKELVEKRIEVLEKIEAEKKEIEERTFGGILFDTVEQRNQAEDDSKTIESIIGGDVKTLGIIKLKEILAEIQAKNFTKEIVADYTAKLSKELSQKEAEVEKEKSKKLSDLNLNSLEKFDEGISQYYDWVEKNGVETAGLDEKIQKLRDAIKESVLSEDGEIYSTVDEAEKARSFLQDFSARLYSTSIADLDGLNALLKEIQESSVLSKEKYIQAIKEKLDEADRLNRTVRGSVYSTREEADTARTESIKMKQETNLSSIASWDDVDKYVAIAQSLVTAELKDAYVGYLNLLKAVCDAQKELVNRNVDYINLSTPGCYTVLVDAMVVQMKAESLGINVSQFIQWHNDICTKYMTINGQRCLDLATAFDKYIAAVEHSKLYFQYLTEKNSTAKKGFLSKMKTGVTGVLYAGYEGEYNFVTANGTRHIPDNLMEEKGLFVKRIEVVNQEVECFVSTVNSARARLDIEDTHEVGCVKYDGYILPKTVSKTEAAVILDIDFSDGRSDQNNSIADAAETEDEIESMSNVEGDKKSDSAKRTALHSATYGDLNPELHKKMKEERAEQLKRGIVNGTLLESYGFPYRSSAIFIDVTLEKIGNSRQTVIDIICAYTRRPYEEVEKMIAKLPVVIMKNGDAILGMDMMEDIKTAGGKVHWKPSK